MDYVCGYANGNKVSVAHFNSHRHSNVASSMYCNQSTMEHCIKWVCDRTENLLPLGLGCWMHLHLKWYSIRIPNTNTYKESRFWQSPYPHYYIHITFSFLCSCFGRRIEFQQDCTTMIPPLRVCSTLRIFHRNGVTMVWACVGLMFCSFVVRRSVYVPFSIVFRCLRLPAKFIFY